MITSPASPININVAATNNFKRFFEISNDKNLSNVEKRVQQISSIAMTIPLIIAAGGKLTPVLMGIPKILASIGAAATAAGGGIAGMGVALNTLLGLGFFSGSFPDSMKHFPERIVFLGLLFLSSLK